MKTLLLVVTLILTLFNSTSVSAEASERNYSPLFLIPDILLFRPVGLGVTVVGTALFVVASPYTAIAQMSPPHNAFDKMADALIMTPAKYTFVRQPGI